MKQELKPNKTYFNHKSSLFKDSEVSEKLKTNNGKDEIYDSLITYLNRKRELNQELASLKSIFYTIEFTLIKTMSRSEKRKWRNIELAFYNGSPYLRTQQEYADLED